MLPVLAHINVKAYKMHHDCWVGGVNLVQTTAGLFLAASISASPCEPCLIDSLGHVLLLRTIPSDSFDLSFLSSVRFPEALRGGT